MCRLRVSGVFFDQGRISNKFFPPLLTTAYIQSSLANMNINEPGISPLGAVMAFLYSAYIVLNAVLSSVLGTVIDASFRQDGNIYNALIRVGGIQFTVCAAIIFASTFIPRGSWALNPKQEGDLVTPDDDENGATMGVDELPKAALTGVAKEGAQPIDAGRSGSGTGSSVDGEGQQYKEERSAAR
jgi:hypothetical protein